MATIYEPQVGDAVRVDDDPRPWRVDAKDAATGMLTLEAMRSINRLTMSNVHEFRVQRAGAFV